MIKKVLIVLISLLPLVGYGQMVTYDTTVLGRYMTVTMPSNWLAGTDSTEGIIWFHGAGEAGQDYAKLRLYGPHYWIADQNTWNGQVDLPNGKHSPVTISFQRGSSEDNMKPDVTKQIVEALFAKYRIKKKARYGIGFSRGAAVMNLTSIYLPTVGDYSYYNTFTAVVSIQCQAPEDTYPGTATLPFPSRFGNWAKVTGGKMLSFEGIKDIRKAFQYINNINDSIPGHGFGLWSNIGGGIHGAGVTDFTNPANNNWTLSNSGIQATNPGNVGTTIPLPPGQNIYQWLLLQGDTVMHGVQPREWFTSEYGNGSQKAYIQLPEGYNTRTDWPVVVFLHGQGERGTNPDDILGAGLPKYLNQGMSIPAIVICPQIPTSNNTWLASITNIAVDYALNNYNTDPNKVIMTGLSLGASGVVLYQQTYPNKVSAVLPASGSYSSTSASADESIKSAYAFIHGTNDGTQNISNAYNLLTQMLSKNPNVIPLTDFKWNGGHDGGVWDDLLYAQFPKWFAWANMQDKDINKVARNYVDSANRSKAWNDIWQADRAIKRLSSGSYKDNLVIELNTIKTAVTYKNGTSRIILGLGDATQPTGYPNINMLDNGQTGQTYPNLKDDNGNTTTIGFTVVSRSGTTSERNYGEEGSVFGGYQNGIYDNAFWISNTSGVWRITGLNNSKKYSLYMSGSSERVSASYKDGLNVTINGITRSIDNQLRNTSKWIEFKEISPNGGNIELSLSPTQTSPISQGFLSFLEIIEYGDPIPGTAVANAGIDTMILKNQTRPDTIVLNGSSSVGTSYLWTQSSGNTMTIVNPTAKNTIAVGNLEGNYRFNIQVTDGSSVANDDFTVMSVDAMKKNIRPKRVGTPQAFTMTPSGGQINYSRITANNQFPDLMGGDTLYIPAGNYTGILIGDVGGSPDAPIIIAPKGGVVNVQNSYFRLGNLDSAIVCYVKLLGNLQEGIPYGFQANNAGIPPENINNPGFTGNFIHHVELAGFKQINNDPAFLVKLDARQTLYGRYDKFIMRGITIRDCYIENSHGEGMYIGHTAPGGGQSGNIYGPPPRMDSVKIYNNFVYNSGWDGIQLSNAGRGCEIYNNVIFNYGLINMSSQQAGLIVGANTIGAKVYNNFIKNGTGNAIQIFGDSTSWVYNNVIDSTDNGAGSTDGMFFQKNTVSPEVVPDIKMMVYNNIVMRSNRYAMRHNLGQGFIPGEIHNNYFVQNAFNQVYGEPNNVYDNTIKDDFPIQFLGSEITSTGTRVTVKQDTETRAFYMGPELTNWLLQRISGSGLTDRFKFRGYKFIQ